MHERISRIIAMEWEMFHSTQNIGGPASCQNDRPQFEIMRKSQFLVWTDAILQSYEQDLLQAIENKQNLVSKHVSGGVLCHSGTTARCFGRKEAVD